MRPLKNFLTLIALLPLLNCAQPIGQGGGTLVLDDFESDSSLLLWKGALSLSTEYPAHGRSCLKLVLDDPRTSFLESDKLPRDWSGYDLLKFDIYNPSGEVRLGSIQIADELGSDQAAEFQGQAYRGEDKIFLNKGWNHFEFQIHKARVENGTRALAMDKLRSFRLDFGRIGGALYLDNFRLVKGREEASTESASNPRDCRVVIDDRYVYPELVGPAERLKPSSSILRLRARAEEAVSRLKSEVDAAKLQGYQTFYWQIPLLTAEVGMEIRSKLIWYQSEEEQKKILEYVSASCSQAWQELDGLLSAQDRHAIEEPEDDVNPQYMYVPPYPSLRGLPQRDGYFRDKNGDPVQVLALLLVDQGPLLDYFAPFSHRIESYTVGGGSRYNIESSPVYEAFHKYQDTHRVGWDGWCGHLIKDQWSMGGKKENLVICLESPHIREAILEYIKEHSHLWRENPQLLYNIMAYELMYICYCEKSQQMFRDWLKTKYGSVEALNRTWRTAYGSFAEMTAPATQNASPLPDVNRAAWYDWAVFNAWRFTDYLKWVKSEMLKHDSEVPICAGGTSSMLSPANSTSGIDEEQIINEVDDVILNESGHSYIFSDLFLSLSEKKKAMADPEMGGDTHGILLHFLHGKSAVAKWWWGRTLSRENHSMDESSIPHGWNTSLEEVAEVLRLGLDVRRLSREIAAFTLPEPELAILYSKTSVVQVPPNLHRAGRTPYLSAVGSAWQGSRFLGCRTGFVSEKQILEGKLSRFKLLIVPAVKYIPPEVADAVLAYVKKGGTALVVPEAFLFDQYAHENGRLGELGLKVNKITLPPVLGQGGKVQNYDMSTSQTLVYGEVKNKIKTGDSDIFKGRPAELQSDGLVQTLEPGSNAVLAHFENGAPALVLVRLGAGSIYYLASPLTPESYHRLLAPLAERVGLTRPLVAVDAAGSLMTGAEVRAVEQKDCYLVYASNLGLEPLEFSLKGPGEHGTVQDLRTLRELPEGPLKLGPWQETIYRVEKAAK